MTLPIIATAKRERVFVAVAMFNLDHFKHVNDAHGHAAGDRLLQLFVEVADSALRAGDVFARFGGEEFVALLVGTTRENLIAVAERVRSAYAETDFAVNGKGLRTTVSVDIGFFTKEETELGPVLRRADEALYQTKDAGRNRYLVAPHQ
jgi:diguanylate cyclase (GGDEF)-like protein